VPRVADLYAALPSITGKLELEYEGELKGGDAVAREVIRGAVARVYTSRLAETNMREVIQFFNLGGTLKVDELTPAAEVVRALEQISGLLERTKHLGVGENEPDGVRAAAGEFLLEGLYALRRIGRSEEVGFTTTEPQKERARDLRQPVEPEEEDPWPPRKNRKRNFN
jgi:magnesium chelatase subunit I